MQAHVLEHTQGQERLFLAPQTLPQEGLSCYQLQALQGQASTVSHTFALLPSWTDPPGADSEAPSQLFPVPNPVLLLGGALLPWGLQGELKHW